MLKGFVVGDVWGRNCLRVPFRFHWVLEGLVLDSEISRTCPSDANPCTSDGAI